MLKEPKMVLLGGESTSVEIDNVFDTWFFELTYSIEYGWKCMCVPPKYRVAEPIPVECKKIEVIDHSKNNGRWFIREYKITVSNETLGQMQFYHKGKIYKSTMEKQIALFDAYCESMRIPFEYNVKEKD